MSNRQQLADLIAAVSADQNEAMIELHQYLTAGDGTAFVQKLEETRGRTLPGGQHDQIIGSLLQVIASVTKMAETSVPKEQPALPEDPTVTEVVEAQEEAEVTETPSEPEPEAASETKTEQSSSD